MATTVMMPKLGFDMAEGTLVRWLRAEGEGIRKGEVLAEIETDKATVEVESTREGTVRKLLVEAGTAVPVGTPIAVIGSPDESIDIASLLAGAEKVSADGAALGEAPKSGVPVAAEPPPPVEAESAGRPRASPLARKIAQESGIDLSAVRGTGPGGRITKRDVQTVGSSAPTASAHGEMTPSPALAAWGTEEEIRRMDRRVPLQRLRQTIGRRMTESKQQAPHFYVTRAFDMGPLLTLRAQANAALPEDGKLTVNDFLVKAVALVLAEFPNLNASIQGNELVWHGSINVGVAVAVEGGLLNVVCRDADRKPLRRISAELREMIGRAREGKVRSQDVEGSTFTISNMGMMQVENFVAIINPPEAAILAVGSVLQSAVVDQGQVKVGQRMKATISADHRVTDGSEAARFLQALAKYVEQPVQLLI